MGITVKTVADIEAATMTREYDYADNGHFVVVDDNYQSPKPRYIRPLSMTARIIPITLWGSLPDGFNL